MADINDIKEWLSEVLGIDTYDGEINEFVDWITGVDSFTNRSVSDGKPISGGSIRSLLQQRLKEPIIVYDDEQAGLYRLFASEVSRDRWITLNNPQDPSSYDPDLAKQLHLEIFNFERPSEFVLSTNISSDPRYIIKGDEGSSSATLEFLVSLKDKDGQPKSDSIIVTYTITNNITGTVQTFSEPYSSAYVNHNDSPVSIDLYKYLSEGINSVNVNIKGTTVSNSVDYGFSVYFISFSLSSEFDFNVEKTAGTAITVPFEINRSSVVSGSILEVRVYVDGAIAYWDNNGSEAVWNTDSIAQRINGTITIRNDYAPSTSENPHVSHTLQIRSEMRAGNTVFDSNTLNYTFEVGSSSSDFLNKFVNIGISMPYNKTLYDSGDVILQGMQYEPFTLDWSYYTDNINNFQSIPVTWAVKIVSGGVMTVKNISTTTARKRGKYTLNYVPETPISADAEAYLVAKYGEEEIDQWPLRVERSSLPVVETSGYNLKLDAYGRSNASPDRNVWRDETNNVGVTFTGVSWDSKSGWDENSFFTIGTDSYARVGYVPFPKEFGSTGRTIEIDFKSEQVNDDSDILLDLGYASAGRIIITPVKASVLLNGTEVVSTHYKANERIKLAFIFNRSNFGNDSRLVYIVNNGILERAAGAGEIGLYTNVNGQFKIGGSQSGVRVYMIRAYDFALTYTDAYNNFVYDSDSKGEILSRNNIVSSGAIVYDECSKKIDTILLEGDMTKLLSMDYTNKDDTETTVNITRFCISDSTKSFTCVNGMARKHGQSTLNYPITSFKIWLNKSADDGVNPVLTLSSVQEAMRLNKNRYIMKDGAIPCNKFVLQANYADSSGANNGSLERLIQDTWYNAQIDNEYKLRTAPELFASGQIVHHNNEEIGETGSKAWVEGYGEGEAYNKTWTDVSSKAFPYVIRHAPDSFPCAVFYKNTAPGSDGNIHFLGQYVFMDDKKSDFVYGERSIYHYYDEADPFCLKVDNADQDKAANRVWNNNNVLRIEVVLLNNTLTSYLDFNVQSAADDPIHRGAVVPCTEIKYDEKGKEVKFYWEDYFEMVYPDPDDLTVKINGQKVVENKFDPNSQFRQKAQVFLDWLKWLTDMAALNVGTKIPGTRITQAVLDEFIRTACEHLDLYKLAAYYIYFLRFGLVDSVERNAQLKTYDGQHWHYEPWDMDIAVGNKNTGGFVFEPPMNRDTTFPDNPSEYAYSGRTPQISNLLWDCLEAWDVWANKIVPDTAVALYNAGLSYDNATLLFDGEYSQKWSEVMYNYSGHYKYVDMRRGNNDWLLWLQGASVSHRHWWLSKSMNYYDAMWSAGDFNNHRVYLNVTKAAHSAGTDLVTIKPTSDTFFKMTQNDGTASLGTLPASRENPAVFDVSSYRFNGKDPTHIYGATFIEELDLSCFAKKMGVLTLTGAYDKVLGAPIKVLNIGIPFSSESTTQKEGFVSGTQLALSASGDDGDALGNIRVLDITGQQSITDSSGLLYDNNRRTLEDLHAIGSGLANFVSSQSGNTFGTLEFPAATYAQGKAPAYLSSIRMINSTWQSISFWETTINSNNISANDDEYPEANTATFDKVDIPATIMLVTLEGSTAGNLCAAEFVMGWIDSIAAKVAVDYPSLHGDALEAKIQEVLHDYQLRAENIYWGTSEVSVSIYYRDLARIACFNHGSNQNANLSGYIKIADSNELSSIQVTQLREWFGEGVFNKGNMSSGLVIDQELGAGYIQINIGRDAYIDTIEGQEMIVLEEGHSATLNATKFLLSDDDTIYDWNITRSPSGASLNIVEGNDGIFRLVAGESTLGDYTIELTANARRSLISRSVDIYIKGVTYPTDWEFHVSPKGNVQTRQFNASANVMTKEFGAGRIYQYGSGSVLRDVYVIYNSFQDFEFYVEATGSNYTATLKKVEYELTSLDTTGNMQKTDASAFSGDGSTVTLIDEGYIYSSNAAAHNGVVLGAKANVPTDFQRYILAAYITIGGTTEIRYLNIIMVADNSVLIPSGNTVLYTTLAAKIGGGIQRSLYKTDLRGIDGTLTFPTGSLGGLVTAQVDGAIKSVFNYLPHVEILDMTGSTFVATDSSITGLDKRVLNVSGMANLTQLVLTNASVSHTYTSELTVEVSGASSLVSFNSIGTSLGISSTNNYYLTTVQMGAPYEIVLKNAILLNAVSVTDNTHFENVDIEYGDSISAVKGFSLFDTLYNSI